MAVKIYKEPKLENPVLIASWPGIGNIGLLAVDTLRNLINAEEFGEIEPMEFFYPRKVVLQNGEIRNLEFPSSRFYYKQLENRDLIIFIGEEQPAESGRTYAEGAKAYRMADMVLDVAVKFGCRRVYTSGAAVAPIHHSVKPRVWAVPNSKNLLDEVKSLANIVLMSDIEERNGQGTITGLNGLLLGVARRRGLEAICLMGEIPVYLQGFPFPYPKASKSVLEAFSTVIGINIETYALDGLIAQSEEGIEHLFESFPSEIKDQIDKLKTITTVHPEQNGPITEDDKKKILEDIDKMFHQHPKGE
ncbi:MAG: PAC2 family protein [Dehalococcoidales bacterium]|nr:PAC2 family protein [Dehalococcoidales bacterium]